jgi:cephalosporin hydroxylase
MANKDDREEFAAERRRSSLALGADDAVFAEARDLIVRADKYKYAYLWTWMGLPIIQMPADIVAMQEAVWKAKPEVIIETGVARGGSVIFSASMLALLGRGKVIGVDIDIRAHNRNSIESHPMASRITLIDGPSTSAETIERVKAEIPLGAAVMVLLDSDHSRAHVLDELRAYGPLVTRGQYLIVADTMLGRLNREQTPTDRAHAWYPGNEPLSALKEYLLECDRFVPDEEMNGKMILSSSPEGYLICVKDREGEI